MRSGRSGWLGPVSCDGIAGVVQNPVKRRLVRLLDGDCYTLIDPLQAGDSSPVRIAQNRLAKGCACVRVYTGCGSAVGLPSEPSIQVKSERSATGRAVV